MMRTLMGVAIFVFMIINGWFAAFAGSTAFYFVILILLGVVYFVMGHFQHGGNPGGGGAPHNFPRIKRRDEYGGDYAVPRVGHAPQSPIEARLSFSTSKRLKEVEEDIRATNAELKSAREANSAHEAEVLQKQLQELVRERNEIIRQRKLL